jgi:hypothetical protein
MMARPKLPAGHEMPEAKPKKVAYLFGAGATHAELANVLPRLTSDAGMQRKLGLLTSDLSARVMKEARSTPGFLDDLEFLEPPHGPGSVEPATGLPGQMNIELLIGLIENCKIHRWEQKTRILKMLVRADIESKLSRRRKALFYLHKALFELHTHPAMRDEQLAAIISLNYDDVLEEAYREFFGKPNYCLALDRDARLLSDIPLLKLHGSFNWRTGVNVRRRRRRVEIIPLGSNKNYVHAPYNFIWTRALEVLIECDTLRVVGCSLSQNDVHLVDLLFKAHLEKAPEEMKAFEIEIVSGERAGKAIRENYGFFPNIKTQKSDPPNPFRTWLGRKIDSARGIDLGKTKYLKRLVRRTDAR